MAFDPVEEDCARLMLESMRREHIYPLDNLGYARRFIRSYTKDPSSLVHTDRDRSFHLIAKATELVDYRIPFLTDESELDAQAEQAETYLQEAAELDGSNWDAQRMLAAIESESNDAYVSYLLDNRQAVQADLAQAEEQAADPYSREYARDLASRPYLRWLAALSSRALIAGQYRLALKVAEESLAYKPADPAGIRHTGMLALAKLESTPEELEAYRKRHAEAYLPHFVSRRRRRLGLDRDAWTLIAEMNVAYRSMDFDQATSKLSSLIRSYPRAAEPLYFQAEFPDGLYSRVNVEPESEDELILALSEATPILQEGYGAPDSASFSLWISENELVQAELEKQPEAARQPRGPHRPNRGSN